MATTSMMMDTSHASGRVFFWCSPSSTPERPISRKKRAILVEKLIRDGFDENDISRIHNPIGLDIGSETPEEIAISIAAEMIAVRAAGGPENKDE